MRRTIEITTRGVSLSRRENLLQIERDGETLGRIAFEDLGVLVIDSTGVSVTSGAIVAAMEQAAVAVFCNASHEPEGILVPVAGNTLHAERLRAQVHASRPLLKNLWRRVVKAKVSCQAQALPPGVGRDKLVRLARDVRSGDPDNVEAQAARLYWGEVFGPGFRRERYGPPPNNLLNYGYMVLRATAARAVCAAGLAPAFGLHHHNRYDPFALAADLMEPYRVWVDRRVCQLFSSGVTEVTKEAKHELLAFMTDPISLRGATAPLQGGVERTAATLAQCFVDARATPKEASLQARKLTLPTFVDIPAGDD